MSAEVEIAYIVSTNFKRLSISDKHIAQARNLISFTNIMLTEHIRCRHEYTVAVSGIV